MRILIATSFPPAPGGLFSSISDLARALALAGAEVTVMNTYQQTLSFKNKEKSPVKRARRAWKELTPSLSFDAVLFQDLILYLAASPPPNKSILTLHAGGANPKMRCQIAHTLPLL